MNTTGWIRGLISHNTSAKEYIEFIAGTQSKEFCLNTYVDENHENFILHMGNYHIAISKKTAETLQKKSPYSLDKYILNLLMEHGFTFDEDRSQYICVVMG